MKLSNLESLKHTAGAIDITHELARLGVFPRLVLDELAEARACAGDPPARIPYPTADVLHLDDSSQHVGFDTAAVYEQARLDARARLAGNVAAQQSLT